jgi:hypothetical protein
MIVSQAIKISLHTSQDHFNNQYHRHIWKLVFNSSALYLTFSINFDKLLKGSLLVNHFVIICRKITPSLCRTSLYLIISIFKNGDRFLFCLLWMIIILCTLYKVINDNTLTFSLVNAWLYLKNFCISFALILSRQ